MDADGDPETAAAGVSSVSTETDPLTGTKIHRSKPIVTSSFIFQDHAAVITVLITITAVLAIVTSIPQALSRPYSALVLYSLLLQTAEVGTAVALLIVNWQVKAYRRPRSRVSL